MGASHWKDVRAWSRPGGSGSDIQVPGGARRLWEEKGGDAKRWGEAWWEGHGDRGLGRKWELQGDRGGAERGTPSSRG